MRAPEVMIIYNLFPLLAGSLPNWRPHIERAARMRFNWIFVNPIQQPGRSGSLYSIADYFACNPMLVDPMSQRTGTDQVRDTLAYAQAHGMRMMIDLVVNHCAVDSPLVKEHPEWFVWDGPGQVAHPFAMDNGRKVIWYDLAKFDHERTSDKDGLFRYFLEVVHFLRGLGFKGFRCDAAYQVPVSFWRRLIQETKAKDPECLFFAETLGCSPDKTLETASAGFDYIFNSSKWWDFESPWLMEQYNLTRSVAPSVSFAESHDTSRLYEELNGNIDGVKQRYVFSVYFSSAVMMTMGFEFGFRKKLHVVETRPTDWETPAVDLTGFIAATNSIKERYTILQEEAVTEILAGNNKAILVMRKISMSRREASLLILNKDIHHRQSFYAQDLRSLLKTGSTLVDVSPERRIEVFPTPLSIELQPGQTIVVMASKRH